ncbi:hypothetical protein B6A10_00225 [Flavobacterium sp. L1I52]|uniref:Uncharacterized protein n=1 Tax=Flavobacterium pokkalii TaxID=1940408 RepID=A0ABR7ULS3_9FLAO|nr:hypothetical protein [Flavobacterium pokkalii]MBD0723598.1 hypothetical protein [Flavobacterium pokkalii]
MNLIKKGILLIIILVFAFVVYNSKTEYYEKSIEFNIKSLNAEIIEIEEGRGTKIHYKEFGTENYFYLEDYQGIKLLKGDVLRKKENEITVMRKNSQDEYVEIGKGKSLNPGDSYFNYFIGI